MSRQIRVRIFATACATAIVCAVSVRALTNWVSADALGDVAVAFDGSVQVFDNANVGAPETITAPALTGANGGLAFDASLNLLVANTAGSQLVKLSPVTHQPVAPPDTGTIATSFPPRAVAIAANGTIYVATPGTPTTTIQRFGVAPDTSGTFTIPTDTNTCIGIDLAPDQSTLFYVSGGRTIRTATGVNTSSPPPVSSTYLTLGDQGMACGLRLLAPADARDNPALAPTAIVGGVLVADDKEIKLVRPTGIVGFDSGTGSKHWLDVAIDPDTGATPAALDFWGVNAGSQPTLVKFRVTGPNPQLAIGLAGLPRGVAVNGELRAAQTVQLVTVNTSSDAVATFLQGTPYQHVWKGLNIDPTNTGPIQLAVEAMEITDAKNQPACDPLNVDCRLVNFPAATPKTYSRNRGVVYREIWRGLVPADPSLYPLLRIGIYFPGPTDLSAGTACVVNGTPKAGSTILRDPWPHNVFESDLMEAFYGGDDGGIIRTKTNDSVVVDRSDARYYLQIIKPAQNTQAQLGSSMQIAVEVRDPKSSCNAVQGLNAALVLTVTDITPGSPDKGKPIGDSRNILGPLDGNGLTWASTASQYRTNLDVDPRFVVGHKYRACVMSPAFYDPATGLPIAGEACVDFFAKGK